MKNEQGFSLVELLIVVAIIAIIAAIAVPSLLTSRMAANESGGVQACRTLGSAEIAYASSSGQQYASISDLVTNQFVDGRFANATTGIGGYTFSEDVAIADPDTTQVVGGAVPDLFGIEAAHIAGMARYDYEIGADQVVRWGTVPAPNKTQHDPIAK
jgi:prepilin-type N-terminal cleavage/methylation domain-containing protein